MNKLISLIFLIVSVIVLANAKQTKVALLDYNDLDTHWNTFKAKSGKKFSSSSHESRRKQTFNRTIQRINELNKKYNEGTLSYISGINQFSDLNPEEFLAFVRQGGLIVPDGVLKNTTSRHVRRQSLPSSVDWRTKGVVSAMKNQGSCGSCWAFSSTGTIESAAAIAGAALPNLSEQNLVDCTKTGYNGCNGGWMSWAYDYVKNTGGINTQSAYPYTGTWSGSCKYNSAASAVSGVKVTGYVSITTESALQSALANKGPVAVAFQVTSNFQSYSSGVFYDSTCTGAVNHAVILDGYGTDSSGKQYYILRNSWGTGFGQGGYVFFARNNNNMCSIASYAIYPTVQVSTVTTTTKPTISTATTTTTKSSLTTTTTKSGATTCNKGSGYYAYSGCKTFYYCSQSISNATCPTGYMFDQVNQYCTSMIISCVTSSGVCASGTAWYSYPGCANVYYCSRTIYNYTAPTGYLFDPSTISYKTASTFKCPI